MYEDIKIEVEDVKPFIYFITSITQKQTTAMQGALSSKADLMGGIFDRWINVIPESVVFNKVILPKLNSNTDKIEIVSDFYIYDPKKAGIANDALGIRVNDKIIPFQVYKLTYDESKKKNVEKWITIDEMPQIEVKTFKKPQKMVSLRNQHYENKYLILVESNIRLDYLVPFITSTVYNDEILDKLKMDDSVFILNNENCNIEQVNKVKDDKTELGYIKLLKVADSDDFMKKATLCEEGVSVQYIKDVVPKTKITGEQINAKLSDYCSQNKSGLYSFNDKWYSGLEDNVPYREVKKKSGTTEKQKVRMLDVSIKNIESISVKKLCANSAYIKATEDAQINEYNLEKNKIYNISLQTLARNGGDQQEYFMHKSLLNYIDDNEQKLINHLKKIINESKGC